MGMFRPSKTEVDALEKDLGLKGWNWDSLLHYMKKVRKPFNISSHPVA